MRKLLTELSLQKGRIVSSAERAVRKRKNNFHEKVTDLSSGKKTKKATVAGQNGYIFLK